MTTFKTDAFQLREIILNSRKPLILHNFAHEWRCFNGSLDEWCQIYDENSGDALNFERMQCRQGNGPQWERQRETISMSAMDFLNEHSTEQEYWTALNYKRAYEIPKACTDGVDFSHFGFTSSCEDFSYWLCSRGANTACHYDTYGCNIVVQVYGRKSWLLFPPETPLTTTRIPYEESSVYCLENFHAPSEKEQKSIVNINNFAYHCVLEANDVLIVPRHWWHYAEALDISLSVNYWIPLKVDVEVQIEECIVKFIIEKMLTGEDKDVLTYALNPNQLQQISDESELCNILKYLYEQSLTAELVIDEKKSRDRQQQYAYQYLSDENFQILLNKSTNISQVPQMTNEAFANFLKENGKRFDLEFRAMNDVLPSLSCIKESLLNSICSPNVIKSIKNEFLKRYKTNEL